MPENTVTTKYLIIGNSAGGIGAAEAIREVDKTGQITIVSDEPYPVYSRPLISEYLGGERTFERMLYRTANFYDDNDIHTFLGSKAEQLDLNKHTIGLRHGVEITWEKLLLATGGLPIIPKMDGMEGDGLFTFTTLDDAKAIDAYLNRTKATQAVVIGGGLIGVSVTEALMKRGVGVTVVEMKERVLNTILDEEGSALENEALRKAGVNIATNHTVAKINRSGANEGAVNGVTLDDGSTIPCDLVIVAIGVVPHTKLVSNTNIKVKHGIVVDRYMTTSQQDVYACGDAAEAYDFVYGKNRPIPIWPNAYLGGRVAGYNMAGTSTEYAGGTAMNAMKYFGLDIATAGMVNALDDSCEILSKKNGDVYHKVILKDGLVVGMIYVGNIEKSGIVFSLIKDRIKVNSFREKILSDDFGLAFLPQELWQERLQTPPPGPIVQLTMPTDTVEDVVCE